MTTVVVYFSLILARVGAFVLVMPLFSGPSTPRLVKIGLTVALTLLWFGSLLPGLPPQDLFDARVPWLALGVALGREALLGALVGFAFGLILVPARVAGEYVTQEMGLSFGAFLDPTTGSGSSGPLTLIFEIITILLFLGMDGHHLILAVLHGTFAQYPVGGPLPEVPVQRLIQGVESAEEWGLVLAAPVGVLLFATGMILVLMTKAAPQLNFYSFGFPLRLAAGFVGILLLLPQLVVGSGNVLAKLQEYLARLL